MLKPDKYLQSNLNNTTLNYNNQKEQYLKEKEVLGKEAAIIHFLNLRHFERLYRCCDDLDQKNKTSQVIFKAIMPIVHDNNPYLRHESMIDTTKSNNYTKLYYDERNTLLREALELRSPNNRYLCKLFAVLDSEKENNTDDEELLRLLTTLWYTLGIFSYQCCQNGLNYLKDCNRTFYIPKNLDKNELLHDPVIEFLHNLSKRIA